MITIPAELSQRFLLREGQELVIYGLSRKGPEFEDSLQVYLGCFVVHEKAPTIVFKVKVSVDELRHLQEVVRGQEAKYLPFKVNISKLEEDLVKVELVFGAITPTTIRQVRGMEEVSLAAAEMEFALSSSGFEVIEKAIVDKIIDWRIIDPAMFSKASYKISEVVRWRWEI